MFALVKPRYVSVILLAAFLLFFVPGLGTVNTDSKAIELKSVIVSIDGVFSRADAEKYVGLAELLVYYRSGEELWKNAVRHALKNHEAAIVRCIDWYRNQSNSTWPEVWLSNTEQVLFEGKLLPAAVAVEDISALLGAKDAKDGPCAEVTTKILEREFGNNGRTYNPNKHKVRIVVAFAKNSVLRAGKVYDLYLPLSMYPVPDWEKFRCEHGYMSMIFPRQGFRPCP